jgi:circadian clock protein KaiB
MTQRPHPEPVAEADEDVHMTLFVSGASDLSARAIAAARLLCDGHLRGHCQLTVLDIHDAPEAAVSCRVYAVPALVRTRPLPVRRVVGDLSQTGHVLSALQLAHAGDGTAEGAA